MPPEKLHWKHLYDEVVTSGLCTGCAGCVIACPHDVLGYNDDEGIYKPFQIEELRRPDDCTHGEKGCTSCTRACPRFRAWEPEVDEFLFGGAREPEELSGIYKDIVLAQASDPGAPRGRPGRRARLGHPPVLPRARHHRRRARVVPRGRRLDVEGDPRRGAQTGRHHRVRGQPLHVLGEPDGVRRGRRGRRRADRAGRDELPELDAAGDEAAQGGQGRAAALAQHRAAVLEDVRRRDLRGAVRGEVRAAQEATSRR